MPFVLPYSVWNGLPEMAPRIVAWPTSMRRPLTLTLSRQLCCASRLKNGLPDLLQGWGQVCLWTTTSSATAKIGCSLSSHKGRL